MTSWLDNYVQTVVTSGTPRAASDWLGYNRLPEDVRAPMRAESNKAEKTAPTLANDLEAAAALKENEAARNRLTMTPVLDYYV